MVVVVVVVVVDVEVVLLRDVAPCADVVVEVTAGALVVVVDGRVDTALWPCGSDVVVEDDPASDVFDRC